MKATPDISLTETFFALVNVEILVWNEMDAAFKDADVGVTLGRFVPLHHLALAQEPMRLLELARCCRTQESATSRLIERMCQDGLVAKEPDEHDRRSVRLRITDQGRKIEAQAFAVFQACLERLFVGCASEQIAPIVALHESLSEKVGARA